ncbi:MAG: M20/M25/M40 family metallo-hydrolase [Emergencia sp.]
MRINEFFEREKDDMLRNLARLMEYRSVTDDSSCCREALQFVLSLAESFGMKTTIGKHEDIGIVEIGRGDTAVGILVHVDVVGEGNADLWKYEPFGLTIDKDMLYGRGIVDDKGPVIANLYAMKYLVDSGMKLKKKIQLIVGTSEESVWTDMEHFKEEFPHPDYGYSPDGNFPIYNEENGYIDISLTFENALPDAVRRIEGGDAENSIPSAATCELVNGDVLCYAGKAAHSSTPELGLNSIVLMCSDLMAKYDFPMAQFICENFPEGRYESAIPFARKDGKTSGKSDLTIVPTTVRTEGKNVTVNLNVRNTYCVTGDSIAEALKLKGKQYGFSVEITELHNPIFVDENQEFIMRMKAASREYGISGECRSAQGSSYAKCLENFVSWGPVFEGDSDCAHMENEEQSMEGYIKCAEIYAYYLQMEGESA